MLGIVRTLAAVVLVFVLVAVAVERTALKVSSCVDVHYV